MVSPQSRHGNVLLWRYWPRGYRLTRLLPRAGGASETSASHHVTGFGWTPKPGRLVCSPRPPSSPCESSDRTPQNPHVERQNAPLARAAHVAGRPSLLETLGAGEHTRHQRHRVRDAQLGVEKPAAQNGSSSSSGRSPSWLALHDSTSSTQAPYSAYHSSSDDSSPGPTPPPPPPPPNPPPIDC